MNIYFDTEFTGLVPNTTLISIGMVAENGAKFYAEFTDYNEELVDDWVQKNVIRNLLIDKVDDTGRIKLAVQWGEDNNPPTMARNRFGCCVRKDNYYGMWVVQGNSEYVAKELWAWLNHFDHVQLISDVCHYDMTLLCNLFGGAFSLPKNVNPCCYDISQMYAERLFKNFDMTPTVVMPVWSAMTVAFEKSREKWCMEVAGKLPEGEKHNALYDAEVIKMIYEAERSMR